MVVLDLLDLQAPSQASVSAANLASKPVSAAAAPGCFRRGEVVFAKYGRTNRFYWARVKKVYKSSSGEQLCDVEWLRPQAGTIAEKTYVLHDGHDETLHGDELRLSFVRRPQPNELTATSPPGAGKVPGTSGTASCKGAEMSDLLGELIVEKAPDQASISDAIFFPPQQSTGSSPPLMQPTVPSAHFQGSVNMQQHGGAPGYGWLHGGSNAQCNNPWAGACASQASSSPWSSSAATQKAFTQSFSAQAGSGMPKPTYAAAPFNDLQEAFASDLLLKPSAGNGSSANIKGSQLKQDARFDFISDMMSGALAGNQGS